MKYLKFTIILLMFFAISQVSNLIADESQINEEISVDTVFTSDDEVKFSLNDELGFNNPTIELVYGFGTPTIKSFVSDFAPIDMAEIRLGFTSYKKNDIDKSLFNYDFNYFFIGSYSSNWKTKENETSSEFNTDSWRFGFAWSDGHGYKIGEKTNIVLYQTDAWTWTKTRFMDTSVINVEKYKMDNFGDAFRFGDYFEGGVKFQIYEPFAINLSYQRGIILPRHLFWYWLGSGTIERAGDWLVDWFADKINEASPTFGPVAYFILHNAYSYGFYELRKSKMSWPFNTTEPLMYDGFNVGMTFAF